MLDQPATTSPALDSYFYDLFLHRLPDVGPINFVRITDAFGDAQTVLQSSLKQLQPFLNAEALQIVGEWQDHGDRSVLGQRTQKDLTWLNQQTDAHILRIQDSTYPAVLREIHRAPPLLFVRGNLDCLNLPQIGIVGSRNPSNGGLENAHRFAAFLANHGFAVTSGLAMGIDAAAHQGALEASGRTLAVMGTGIDLVYPSRHQSLAQQILSQGGALISELPLGSPAQAANFPQRNRIISGLSCGILVVEAALKSGSLITAQTAVSQNREVFAIPGSIHNPLARGCHQLIRQGATLVETAQDIVDQLGGLLSFQAALIQRPMKTTRINKQTPAPQIAPELLSETDQQLLNAMGFDPVDLDTLVERTGLNVGSLAAQLVQLEMKGAIQPQGAAYIRV